MIYKTLVRPVLDRLDSETWHANAREFMRLCEGSRPGLRFLELVSGGRVRDERLAVTVGGVSFENPLVVGAGWDKSARAVRALRSIGFAGVEIGSVVKRPQKGNPRPRQFMVAPGVCVNSLGLNSPGMDVVYGNLRRYGSLGFPVGINLGINSDTSRGDAPGEYAEVCARFRDVASYFAVNVSSPNTPGLRKLQRRDELEAVVGAVKESLGDGTGGEKPVFVKISPDLSPGAVDDVVRVVVDSGISGIIAANTTADPSLKGKYGRRWKDVPGGLSGNDPEYARLSTSIISRVYRVSGGRIGIIGAGGVCDAASAVEKLAAGASALQVVTGIRGEGLCVANSINAGILRFMERNGIRSVGEITGSAR